MVKNRIKLAIRVPGSNTEIIKPLIGFKDDIKKQISKFSYERNVFLMMRFRKDNRDLSNFIIKTLGEAGLVGVRADQPEWNITNNVYNPIAVLYCCKYGIALFDKAELDQAYNPNVIYELAIMHSLSRQCLILKNDSLPNVPFDLIKDLYMPYKGAIAARTNIQRWLKRIAPPKAGLSRGKTRLEDVAYAITTVRNSIFTPPSIKASKLAWRIGSKDKKVWRVSWSIMLLNNGAKEDLITSQILFLDKDGFALQDHSGPRKRLPIKKAVRYSASILMSPDLAGRIQRAVVTVS